jgi:oxygen-independent coproporphyrinogen-3 oxidase
MLRDRGFLTTDADSLRLTRDGLLQVDRLLYEFFLPEHLVGQAVSLP